VTLVDSDPQALKDFEEVKSYIIDELNVLEFKTESNEDEFINYKCEPDNREIGSVLKKAYDKKLKKEIASLSTAQLRDYLKNGSLMIGDIKIESGWLKVEKFFNDKYALNPDFASASNMTSSVMLRTVMDDNLKQMGLSREITNRIQKLRKSAGVQIDDQIEVFYSLPEEKSGIREVVEGHSDKIQGLIRMPFLAAKGFKGPNHILIAETTYENSQNTSEVVTLYICKPAVQVMDAEILKSYPGVNIESLGAYLNSFDAKALQSQVASGNGVLKLNLDDTVLELKHK